MVRPAHERVLARLTGTDDPAACWLWSGATFRYGYGHVRRWDGERWTNVGAHRVMYEHVHGPVPPGLVVLHTCDTPSCCNPAHLAVGTQGENLRGMAARGRAPNQRFTPEVERTIAARQQAGERPAHLAAEYGCDPNTIRRIVRRRC